ncbi:MAG: hypothetical protein ACE5E3_04415 [Mariprofundus sp.]
MKQSIFNVLVLLIGLGLTACAGKSQVVASGLSSDYIHQQIESALSLWQQQHDYDNAVMRLERLDGMYGGGIEQARLTALSMIHFERGNRLAFIQYANRLATTISSFEFVEPQSRYVVTVAWAMQGKAESDLPGHGYDSQRVRTIYRGVGGQPLVAIIHDSGGEIILLVIIHALAFSVFFGADDSTPPQTRSTVAVEESSAWNHVAGYAARLERKAANAEQYFK